MLLKPSDVILILDIKIPYFYFHIWHKITKCIRAQSVSEVIPDLHLFFQRASLDLNYHSLLLTIIGR